MNLPIESACESERIRCPRMTADVDPAQSSKRKLSSVLYVTGAVTLVVGILLGLLFGAVYYLIAVFALVDFAFAWLYDSGRLTPPSSTAGEGDRVAAAEAQGESDSEPVADSDSDSDSNYNPARED